MAFVRLRTRMTTGQSTSVWMDTRGPLRLQPLSDNAETEVCVVGAGIAGLTTAYLLLREGKKVLILDKGTIGGGETERTTAHLASALDDRFAFIEKVRGLDATRRAAESHGAAIDTIEEIMHAEHIDCGFERIDGYLFLAPDDSPDILDEEQAVLERMGWEGVERLPRAPLQFFNTGPCLRFPRQGQFHPLRYLSQLAERIEAMGGRIHTGTHVSFIREEDPVMLETESGAAVRADSVIVATNAPINDNAAIFTKQAAYRTYVIALRIPKGAVPHALYWDTLDAYHYVRLQPDDDQTELLIVGGEDHKTGQAVDAEERYRALEAWTRERFPAAKDSAYRWSGQVMETMDGLGMIGRKPMGGKNVYIATGDSGMGMTHGTIAGLLLTDLVMGRKNRWEELYDPSRLPLAGGAGKGLLAENADVGAQFVKDRMTPGSVASAGEVQPGAGAILRKGITKIALYRDENGSLHSCSAICPHKGCVVHWNAGEKSWDCPCHGSRFNVEGKVLNGPASKGLEEAHVSDENKKNEAIKQ